MKSSRVIPPPLLVLVLVHLLLLRLLLRVANRTPPRDYLLCTRLDTKLPMIKPPSVRQPFLSQWYKDEISPLPGHEHTSRYFPHSSPRFPIPNPPGKRNILQDGQGAQDLARPFPPNPTHPPTYTYSFTPLTHSLTHPVPLHLLATPNKGEVDLSQTTTNRSPHSKKEKRRRRAQIPSQVQRGKKTTQAM